MKRASVFKKKLESLYLITPFLLHYPDTDIGLQVKAFNNWVNHTGRERLIRSHSSARFCFELGACPSLRSKIVSISCNFLEKFGNIVGWHPFLEGWHPLLKEILDPPLSCQNILIQYHKFI